MSPPDAGSRVMTEAEVQAYAADRARAFNRRFLIFGLAVLAVLLSFGAILQGQINDVAENSARMCEQRRGNAIRSVAYYDGMIAIEQGNKFIDDALRKQRVDLFESAKPVIPDCA